MTNRCEICGKQMNFLRRYFTSSYIGAGQFNILACSSCARKYQEPKEKERKEKVREIKKRIREYEDRNKLWDPNRSCEKCKYLEKKKWNGIEYFHCKQKNTYGLFTDNLSKDFCFEYVKKKR